VIHALEVPIQEYHLVPVLEAFCKHRMLEDAFSIINLMRSSRVTVSQETAVPILACINNDVDEVDKAWAILEKMNKDDKLVDVVSLNVIIQASTQLNDLQRAVGTYKAYSDLGVKPSVVTFNILLSGCISASHRELGDKMLAELREQGLVPDAQTFERVILLCLTQTTYEDAFFYLEEMKGQGHPPPLSVYEALVKKCVVSGDMRWKLALEELRECGYRVSPYLQQFVDTGGKLSDRAKRIAQDLGEEARGDQGA
jgi:pentatricopeptide repeat protein